MNKRRDMSPAYWREHYGLDSMPVGSKIDVIDGYVARVRPREYCLHHIQPQERARWGTSQEISEDIAYLALWGVLPKAAGGRW
jgi:hypothetical protein